MSTTASSPDDVTSPEDPARGAVDGSPQPPETATWPDPQDASGLPDSSPAASTSEDGIESDTWTQPPGWAEAESKGWVEPTGWVDPELADEPGGAVPAGAPGDLTVGTGPEPWIDEDWAEPWPPPSSWVAPEPPTADADEPYAISDPTGASGAEAVSYTHLTLPTNREV